VAVADWIGDGPALTTSMRTVTVSPGCIKPSPPMPPLSSRLLFPLSLVTCTAYGVR
jgi:hypothetical protein